MKKHVIPGLLLGLLLAGCVAPQTMSLRNAPPSADPAVVELNNLPFHPQEAEQGGPAAMATLLGFTGKPVPPETLAQQMAAAGEKGDAPSLALVMAARRQGRLVYPIAPQLEAILTALHQGYPVLVLQNNGFALFPRWRYAVVVGADRNQEKFVLRSGAEQRLEVPFAAFERRWARAGYWGVLMFDPAEIPENLDARAVIRELALMERAGAVAEAQAGFNRAVLNWPEQKPAWLGLASTSLALGQTDRAESTLRELVRRAPQYGPGLNNLADLLLKTGRPLEALPLAERAVAVLDIPATRATLEAAHQALAPIKSEALPPPPGQQDVAVAGKPPVAKAVPKTKKRLKKGRKSTVRDASRSRAAPAEASRSAAPAP